MCKLFGRFFVLASGVICVVALCSPWLNGQQENSRADIVLHNGKIITVDSNFSTAQGVALAGNKIIAVGSNDDVLKLAAPGALVIDLKGRTVVPGLVDSHIHTEQMARRFYGGELGPVKLREEKLREFAVDWRGISAKDDLVNELKGIMAEHHFKPGEWIYFNNVLPFTNGGGNIAQAKILMDDMSRYDVDKVAPDNPVALGMGIPPPAGYLINSKAIEILWKEHGDLIKKYGRYWIDSSGKPDGHVEIPLARLLLEKYLPQPAAEDLAILYKKYADEQSSEGLTTVSTKLQANDVKAYQLLESKGELTVRMAWGMQEAFASIGDFKNGLKPFKGLVGTGTDKVWLDSIGPTNVDGSATRACTNEKRLNPYGTVNQWWPTGQCNVDVEFRGPRGARVQGDYIRDWNFAAAREGLRFANTHVAGDRSVGVLLNEFEDIQRQMGPSATKNWALDHCFMVNPADFKRAARLGIMFSCAPMYITDSPNVAKAYGDQVANTFIVPLQSMLNAGVKVVYEADSDAYPWYELELYMTRNVQGKVWGPQERIDRVTALKMITINSAEYVLKPDKLGSIEPGKLADLVVLDKDYMTIPVEEVHTIAPQVTIMDGRIVYVYPKFAEEYNLRPSGAIIATHEDLKRRRTAENSLPTGM